MVRGEVLAGFLTGDFAADRPALQLIGARITGELHLYSAEVAFPLMFWDCVFEQTPDLNWARLRILSLSGCELPGLWAANVRTEGDLRLTESQVNGEVRLAGGHITGNVILDGTRLTNPSGFTLHAEHLTVDGSLDGRDGFSSVGEMVLNAARIGAALDLEGAELSAPGGTALEASNITAEVGMFARSVTVSGEVSLRFARFKGPLTFTGSLIDNPGGLAIRGAGIVAEGGIFLSRLQAKGQIRLEGATAGRMFNLDGAVLRNPDGVALDATGMVVDGALHARQRLTSEGEISLLDASISGSAHFEGATMTNPGGATLIADGITVGKVLNLCDGFTSQGRITLTNARVGSALCFANASVQAPGDLALKCWGLETRELVMRTRAPIEGAVDLRHARTGVFRDDPSTWPTQMHRDGLTYDVLEPMLPAAPRLDWLSGDPDGYIPNAYEQLAAMYRRLGNDIDARNTLLASHQRRRVSLPWYSRWWGYLQDATVGYGYRPLRAASWLLLLFALGTVAFSATEPPPLKAGEHPPFSAVIYALDLLVPIIDFGQASAFNPQDWTRWLAYTLIAAGWLLATTIAAGVTRALRRA